MGVTSTGEYYHFWRANYGCHRRYSQLVYSFPGSGGGMTAGRSGVPLPT